MSKQTSWAQRLRPAIVVLAIVLLLRSQPTQAERAEWRRQNPLFEASLIGVWGSSGSDVFAVGNAGTILHYDGSLGRVWTVARHEPLMGCGAVRAATSLPWA